MLAIYSRKPTILLPSIALAMLCILMYCLYLPEFLSWNLNLGLGLLLAPYIANPNPNKFTLRYLIPTLVLLVVTICVPVKTLFFITMIFAFLFLVENSIGKLSETLVPLILLSSPVFQYLVSPVDFPIRLWLTEKTTEFLHMMGISARAMGNVIEMGNYTFAVDPACAGLNMLAISLMICLFTYVHYGKTMEKKLSPWMLVALLLLTVGLNVFSNFFRILLLVLFKLMPGTFLHDFTGIVCLIVYVILPLLVGIRLLFQHFGKDERLPSQKGDHFNRNFTGVRFPWLHAMIFITLICVGANLVSADTFSANNSGIQIKGFHKKEFDTGILKFTNKEALIYLKPAPFFVPGHDPKLCWTGSGYKFQQIKKEKMANVDVYTALLTKDSDRIYAAWWFDDGYMSTVDQMAWRWKGLTQSSRFYLINVNASDRNTLASQVKHLLSNRSSILFTQ